MKKSDYWMEVLRVRCVRKEHIHRRGVIYLLVSLKNPEKQNNITVISQTTISQ